MLEAALRSALLALERAQAEQQRQRGGCGLCAPCLFPPCANSTHRCPRESRPPCSYPNHTPFPRDPTQTLPRASPRDPKHPKTQKTLPAPRPYPNHIPPISVRPHSLPQSSPQTNPYHLKTPQKHHPTQTVPHPLEFLPYPKYHLIRAKSFPKHPGDPTKTTQHSPPPFPLPTRPGVTRVEAGMVRG